jgi:hypothetical protein
MTQFLPGKLTFHGKALKSVACVALVRKATDKSGRMWPADRQFDHAAVTHILHKAQLKLWANIFSNSAKIDLHMQYRANKLLKIAKDPFK